MIGGSIVALVTPMQTNGEIDWQCLSGLLDWHIEEGTDAIVPVGTTGESATLSVKEHKQVIEYVVKQVAGRVPVIAGTGGNATDEAIELSNAAKDAGADACLLVTPYYNKPTQEGLYQHYTKIADAVDMPQLLYNVPGRTACDMLADTVARTAVHDRIIGIKEATGDLQRAKQIRSLCGEDFLILSGDDATSCDLMLQGAQGTISVTANVVPNAVSQMVKAATGGDTAEAKALDGPLMALHENLFLESNPIPVKWALKETGRIPDGIRLPLTTLSEKYHAQVRDAMSGAGVSC